MSVGKLACWIVAALLFMPLTMALNGWGWVAVPVVGGAYVVFAHRKKTRERQDLQQLASLPLTPIAPASALLRPGEQAYGAVFARLQELKTVGYKSGTTGVSVRVAKGVTLRSSGTRGHAVKGSVTVASGELVITDQRVIFAGDAKSFAVALSDLLNVSHYENGLALHDSKGTYTLVTQSRRDKAVFEIAMSKVLSRRAEPAASVAVTDQAPSRQNSASVALMAPTRT